MIGTRADNDAGHQPVLLKEVLRYLAPQPGEFMIDGTVDGGGHAAAILEKIMPGGIFLGVDWDSRMIVARTAEKRFGAHEEYVHGNYADLPAILERKKLGRADGLLLDLGFSSLQLASAGRGFSFSEGAKDEPLLMTYDDSRPPVAEILRQLSADALTGILRDLGGERWARRIAQAIVSRGRVRKILTSGELADVVRAAVPRGYERGRIDAATRTFQALRIYANDELGNLERALGQLANILKPGGRAAVITFHSLEDRIVKQVFQKLAQTKHLEILTKKPIEPARAEVFKNPRSRSAKVRAARIL